MNAILLENIRKLNDDMYMTITVLDILGEGRIRFSGLHQDIMIYRRDRKSVEVIETNGMWLGLVDRGQEIFSNDQISLGIGDSILLYTDGITEARNKDHEERSDRSPFEMFGEERLLELYSRTGEHPPGEIRNEIVTALQDYSRPDDVTLVVLKRIE